MHLLEPHIVALRAFLSKETSYFLKPINTIDAELIRVWTGWVTGVRGITGHSGAFPANLEQLPAEVKAMITQPPATPPVEPPKAAVQEPAVSPTVAPPVEKNAPNTKAQAK